MPDDYDLQPVDYTPQFAEPFAIPQTPVTPEQTARFREGAATLFRNTVGAPGVVAQPIAPSTPGMWSDEDEARRLATEGRATDWAPQQALNMVGQGAPMAVEGTAGVAGGKLAAKALEAAEETPPIRAYHGSPHDFEPSDFRSGGAVENVPSTAHEASSDILTSHAEDFGKFAVAHSLFVKGFGSLDVKSREMVLPLMRTLLQDNEIGKAVVRLLPVDVMHVLGGEKFTPEALFDNQSMLINLLPANADHSVASRVKAVDVLAPYVARATAECPLVGAHGASLLQKALAARSAKKGDLHIRSKIPYPYDLVPINYDPFKDDAKHAKGGAVKLAHASVGYVAQSTHLPQKCGRCTMFLPPSGCTLVQSPIKAGGWCRRFEEKR